MAHLLWRHAGRLPTQPRRAEYIGAISAWLRLGEQQAEKRDGPKYDKVRFERVLGTIRNLTIESPEIFEPQMRNLLFEVGVTLVLVPAIPRAHVGGVARWLGSNRPLIQLSLYGKTNDKFWFTFFHEAAHILLHANNKEEKKSVFLDDPTASHSSDVQEREANQWAGDWLIPPHHTAALRGLRTKAAVVQFARGIGIHPGIVVGRLQHDGLIDRSWMNDLKQSFRFNDAVDV
jgi:HTH-type transcriptional regulator/antitoxin HigA